MRGGPWFSHFHQPYSWQIGTGRARFLSGLVVVYAFPPYTSGLTLQILDLTHTGCPV